MKIKTETIYHDFFLLYNDLRRPYLRQRYTGKKVDLLRDSAGTDERYRYRSTLSLTSALGGGGGGGGGGDGWSTPRPSRFTSEKENQYHCKRSCVGPTARLDSYEKSGPLPAFDPQTVQHVA
jgi:hypothetical protein